MPPLLLPVQLLRGKQLLTSELQQVATELMAQETPMLWSDRTPGPDDPLDYLRALISRIVAVQKWAQQAEQGVLFNAPLDLSDLFNPATFLNAFRQQVALELRLPMDSLRLQCSWRGDGGGARRVGAARRGPAARGRHVQRCGARGQRARRAGHEFVAHLRGHVGAGRGARRRRGRGRRDAHAARLLRSPARAARRRDGVPERRQPGRLDSGLRRAR